MNGRIYNWLAAAVAKFNSLIITVALLFGVSGVAIGDEARWIWSPDHGKEAVPTGAICHFRKSINARNPEAGQIAIIADDQYELYINGRRIGAGDATRKLDEYDISRYLTRGNNIIAIRVINVSGNTAALAARVSIRDRGQWGAYSTDSTWKTSLRALPLWNTMLYNDQGWQLSQSYGELGSTTPWDRRETVPVKEIARSERFTIDSNFDVQMVMPGDQTGSLIAMTFNEFGHILAAKEGGGLLLIYDGNGDKLPDRVRTYCDKVQNIQGILALNGDVFVTGEGPDGHGLYRLSDKDRDGVLENVRTLVKFTCSVGEHGPHGLVLGPDGLIYVVVGNHATPDREYEEGSPYRGYYDTDLVPKYEDPGGHAIGIKAPGGAIIRTDTEGSGVQIVAGGLRNPYDLAFNRDGELFIHDADMESDEGTTWYRQTRVCHIVPGGEYGWRSGWSKWPEYYIDSLPVTLDTGRGSPAGMATYNHFMFPTRYHGALFTADWSQGRILVVRMKRNGASYTASSEVFLEGNPLNVTDLEVGPDGWLYFVTGGRGTSGGIYRVTWRGQVPKEISDIGSGLTAVIRQPQPSSSWSRQNIAGLRKQLGAKWDESLIGVVLTASNPPNYRLQSLDLMQLYGPAPTPELLIDLSHDPNEIIRARAAELMGMHANRPTHERLVAMLDDTERSVRRKVCEALTRADQTPPLNKLVPLLGSDDRFEASAARRVLERMNPAEWRGPLLSSPNHRLQAQGSLALLVAEPSRENSLAVLEQLSKTMRGFVSDRDFLDMLRVMQIALTRGKLEPAEVPGLRQQLAEEFPSGNVLMNRELVRLLAYFNEPSLIDRVLTYVKSDAPDVDKLHVAMYLRFIDNGWTPEQRLELLSFYEEANRRKGGGSYARYIINITRDFCQQLNEAESRLVLAQGQKWPNAALGALFKLPPKLDDELLASLIALDGQLSTMAADPANKPTEPVGLAGKPGQGGNDAAGSIMRLQVGIIAVLARSGDEASVAHLRKIWNESPERRQTVAMGLAQQPGGENWKYLLNSLPILEPAAAREICAKLTEVDLNPTEAEPYRQVILLGLKMRKKEPEKDNAAANSLGLLSFWTGQELAAGESEDKQLEAWQKWFTEKYPGELEAKLPPESESGKYTIEELLEYLASDDAHGTASRGPDVFLKAQCAKCHRFGSQGESLGPDLTTIAKRFTRREMLESILHPSQVISSQYASKNIITKDGRQLTGMVLPGTAGETVILLATGERVTLRPADIESIQTSKVSAMPAGLLDPLSPEEIADLIALLQGTNAPPVIVRRPGTPTAK